MSNPQEQFTELTRRTQENFKHLWEQWTHRSNELLKGVGGRSRSTGGAPGPDASGSAGGCGCQTGYGGGYPPAAFMLLLIGYALRRRPAR